MTIFVHPQVHPLTAATIFSLFTLVVVVDAVWFWLADKLSGATEARTIYNIHSKDLVYASIFIYLFVGIAYAGRATLTLCHRKILQNAFVNGSLMACIRMATVLTAAAWYDSFSNVDTLNAVLKTYSNYTLLINCRLQTLSLVLTVLLEGVLMSINFVVYGSHSTLEKPTDYSLEAVAVMRGKMTR